ncbi:MAG: hypothetical protein Nk1A_8020 [Endomicrobiia bacterium]|nr:MAG: hypothetical protein Nk1A_8020 [Endomicrobiia bacterium]
MKKDGEFREILKDVTEYLNEETLEIAYEANK